MIHLLLFILWIVTFLIGLGYFIIYTRYEEVKHAHICALCGFLLICINIIYHYY